LEVRELLSRYEFPGDDIPVIRGSALQALEQGSGSREDPNSAAIWELMDAVDSYIPTPTRAVDRPFLMPVEDVFGIKGRGTVATGRIERGLVHTSESVELIGMGAPTRSIVVTMLVAGTSNKDPECFRGQSTDGHSAETAARTRCCESLD